MPIKNELKRREFLATGAPGTAPASERITLGTIGCGDQDVVERALQTGKNTILMKVLNEAGPWEFCLRLTNRQEKPIDTSKLTPRSLLSGPRQGVRHMPAPFENKKHEYSLRIATLQTEMREIKLWNKGN